MTDPLSLFVDVSENQAHHFFDRTPVKAVPKRTDGAAVVIDRVEVTAALGQPLAGYGITFDRFTRGWMHPQYATLILMDDGAGGRSLIIGFDLHAATRWVAEAVAAQTGPSIGVGIDRLFVTATHSHAGGGNFYGVQFYDKMVTNQSGPGFDDTWPKAMVANIAAKAKDMATRLEAGAGRNPRLGFGEKCVWGPIWQRAFLAHLANFGDVSKMDQDALVDAVTTASLALNDEAAPAGTKPRRLAVDARVRCLTWEADGQPIGVLAFVGVTPTMFHANAQIAGGDGLGYAARYAEMQIGVATGRPVYVSANGSAHGDTFLTRGDDFTAFHDEREEAWKTWETLAPYARGVVEVGAQVGAALTKAVTRGRAASSGSPDAERKYSNKLTPVPDGVHFTEDVMAGKPVRFEAAPANAAPLTAGKSAVDPAGATLASTGAVGDGMMAGDPLEAGVPDLLVPHDWPNASADTPPRHVGRGVRDGFDAADPQSPKTFSGLSKISGRLGGKPEALFSPFCTLRALHFGQTSVQGGGLTLVGVPFEPTTRGTYEIEQAVVAGGLHTDRALVACLAGDYLGYLVTREEYMAQLYEGGSSWFGRNTHKWVVGKIRETIGKPSAVTFKRAWFTSTPMKIPYNLPMPDPQAVVTPDHVSDHWVINPAVASTGPDGKPWVTLGGTWSAAPDGKGFHARAGQPAWLRLHVKDAAGTSPAHLDDNTPADDKCGWITLVRDRVRGETFLRWRWQYHGPLPASWRGKQITFQVLNTAAGVQPLKVASPAVFVKVP